jgi:hypothetical protein
MEPIKSHSLPSKQHRLDIETYKNFVVVTIELSFTNWSNILMEVNNDLDGERKGIHDYLMSIFKNPSHQMIVFHNESDNIDFYRKHGITQPFDDNLWFKTIVFTFDEKDFDVATKKVYNLIKQSNNRFLGKKKYLLF